MAHKSKPKHEKQSEPPVAASAVIAEPIELPPVPVPPPGVRMLALVIYGAIIICTIVGIAALGSHHPKRVERPGPASQIQAENAADIVALKAEMSELEQNDELRGSQIVADEARLERAEAQAARMRRIEREVNDLRSRVAQMEVDK